MTTLSPIEIYLNSKYADLYLNGKEDNSDMLFYFSQPITKPLDYEMRLRLSSLVFPLSYTLVNQDNDLLVIDGVDYILSHGNYNALSLKTHLVDLLPESYDITFDGISNKYTFTNGSDFQIEDTSTCLLLLGFTEGVVHTSDGGILISDSVVNLSGAVNVIYVDIRNITTFNLSSTSGQRTSVIKSIPVSASQGSVLYWENTTDSFVHLQDDVLSFFHVRLLGEDLATPIRFNTQHWNATIEISFVKKPQQTELTNKSFSQAYTGYVENLLSSNEGRPTSASAGKAI